MLILLGYPSSDLQSVVRHPPSQGVGQVRGYKLYRSLVTRDGTLLPPDTKVVVMDEWQSVCTCRVTPKNSPSFECEIDTAAVKAAFPSDEDDRAVGYDEMREWIYGDGEHPLSPTVARRRMRKRIEADVANGWDILERTDTSARLYRRRRWWDKGSESVGAQEAMFGAAMEAALAAATLGLAIPSIVGGYRGQPAIRYRNYKVAENGELFVWNEPPVLNDSHPPG